VSHSGRAREGRLDSLAYLPLQDINVIDLDTAKPYTPAKEGKTTVIKLHPPMDVKAFLENDRAPAQPGIHFSGNAVFQ
jgi:hypothetical protein